ncbi:MAG TPA: DUF6569 family protein [Pyrinomonadaceae bacterium]|jgi:hypothetical protein
MNRKTFVLLVAVLTLTVGIVVAKLSRPRSQTPKQPDAKPEAAVSNYELSGPYTYENLTIFLIHGPDQPNSKVFMPLQEAMERKVVIVHETSDVNELAIENVSRTEEVLVQAGDIVKGGQQDRVLAVDLLLPPRSGRIPIDAFCVEQGRWQQRGQEGVAQFDSSNEMVATRSLKMAAKEAKSQSGVWREVGEAQTKLSRSVDEDVRSSVSRSSLQLALENEKVHQSTTAYVTKLSSIMEGKNDVIGYVFAINDKINSADLYSSHELFRRFWPKLLKTTAIEAVAERASGQKGETVSAEAMKAFFASAERGKESTSNVTDRYQMIKREGEQGLFFETRDLSQKGVWLHRSFLAK